MACKPQGFCVCILLSKGRKHILSGFEILQLPSSLGERSGACVSVCGRLHIVKDRLEVNAGDIHVERGYKGIDSEAYQEPTVEETGISCW